MECIKKKELLRHRVAVRCGPGWRRGYFMV